MEDKIEKLLELIDSIVEDSRIHWNTKRDMIQKKAAESERLESSLEEFNSWFLPDDDD